MRMFNDPKSRVGRLTLIGGLVLTQNSYFPHKLGQKRANLVDVNNLSINIYQQFLF